MVAHVGGAMEGMGTSMGLWRKRDFRESQSFSHPPQHGDQNPPFGTDVSFCALVKGEPGEDGKPGRQGIPGSPGEKVGEELTQVLCNKERSLLQPLPQSRACLRLCLHAGLCFKTL